MKTFRKSVSGQAAVELVACLLLLVMVITGMIHVANMGRASINLHAAVRGEAGEKAMDGRGTASSPPYISDWTPGPDGIRYTADDVPDHGMVSSTTGDLTAYSFRSPGDAMYAANSRRPVSMIRLSESPGMVLDYVHEERSVRVFLATFLQQLVYNKEAVTIKEEVYMPVMGDLF